MVRFEMSQLNEQLSDLYKKAGIEMDDKAASNSGSKVLLHDVTRFEKV